MVIVRRKTEKSISHSFTDERYKTKIQYILRPFLFINIERLNKKPSKIQHFSEISRYSQNKTLESKPIQHIYI